MQILPKFNKKIRNVITLSFLFPVVLLVLLSGLFFHYIAKKTMEEEMGRRLITIANMVSLQAKDWGFTTLSPGDETSRTYTSIKSKLKRLRDSSQVKKIYIFDSNNLSLTDSNDNFPIGSTYYNHALHTNELNLTKQGKSVSSILFKGGDGNYYKSGFAPIFNNKNEIIGFIGVEGSAEFFLSLERLKKNLLFFILVGTITTVLIGIIISGKIVSPIKNLVRAANDIGEGNMESEIKIGSKNEIGFLAHTINEMRENIIERDNQLRAMMQGIAHEVRNPLGGIELFTGLLKEDLRGDREKIQYVEKILNEITNLKSVIEEFLDFAKSVKPIPTNVEMKNFLEELKLNFLNELIQKEIDFKFIISKEADSLFFDPDQMKRALLNIIRNALDATPKRGEIKLECATYDNHEIISVTDSGRGIQKDIIPKIFDPFFTTKERGSGLGLSFVKKIVNSHNGDIKIASAEGKGTTVTIILPKLQKVSIL